MKALKLNLFTILCCCLSFSLFAQQENEVIIITTDDNGTQQETHTFTIDNDAEINIDGNGEIEVDVEEVDGMKTVRIQKMGDNGEMKVIEWTSDGDMPEDIEDVMIFKSGNNGNSNFNFQSCDQSKAQSTKPLLGVYLAKKVTNINGIETTEGGSDKGVRVDDIVNGGGAEAAGIQSEDIILLIDGTQMVEMDDIGQKLAAYKVGDQVTVRFDRAGNEQEVVVTLTGERQRRQHPVHKYKQMYKNHFKEAVDPCKVFIGVYLDVHPSSTQKGLPVNQVIPNTPAAAAGIQVGDIITRIDDVAVKSHNAIITERDKHEAGDEFTIAYIRDGENLEVDARFNECDVKEDVVEAPIFEESENINVPPSIPALEVLELEGFRAFPNPTEGIINLRFRGETVATVLTIVDITGKEVYREELNNFDGNYNNQINLSNETAAGTIFLNIRQGKKVYTEQVVYTNGRI